MERERPGNSYHHHLQAPFVFRKHMIIRREFEQLLGRNGLDDFDKLMKFENGEVVKRKIEERFTVRFQLFDGMGDQDVYLKRYRYRMIPAYLKSFATFSIPYTAAHEWRNLHAFHDCNLPTMIPVAVGMRTRIPFVKESFILTLGIPDTETLERVVEDRFRPPLDAKQRKRKWVLIDEVAALAGRMHDAGFKHQDFYLCHILINWKDSALPRLFIADLHRVKKMRSLRKGWRVKDVAALNYSAPEGIISRTDRLRFLKRYNPMLSRDRSFIRAIVRKTERIRHHTEKQWQ
ncbi:MAG: hypothetical protein JXD19_05395 [Deltaproteobacteria bacterium]|nr:hypothetical protein [Deltaproteobacteria bacterium]